MTWRGDTDVTGTQTPTPRPSCPQPVATPKNGVFGDVTPCGSCKNGLTSLKTPFFSHRRENLKSYTVATPVALSYLLVTVKTSLTTGVPNLVCRLSENDNLPSTCEKSGDTYAVGPVKKYYLCHCTTEVNWSRKWTSTLVEETAGQAGMKPGVCK
jgi:hypothetical protein